jgi:hypothetical protein
VKSPDIIEPQAASTVWRVRRGALTQRWRKDNRRVSNGDQVSRVAALAMVRGKSVHFTGYWQRLIAD